MRPILKLSVPAFVASMSLISLAGGCGEGPSGRELEENNKKNMEDEMRPPPPIPKGQRPV